MTQQRQLDEMRTQIAELASIIALLLEAHKSIVLLLSREVELEDVETRH